AKSFRRFGRIRLDETAVRVRQIHAKIMEANLLAADVPIRLAKIRLRMTWTMAQWHEHLPRPQHLRRYILTHDRVATAKALFVPQPLENPMRHVPLFLVNAAVAFKNGVDPRHISADEADACRPIGRFRASARCSAWRKSGATATME